MQASLPRFFSGFFFGVLRTLAELRSADCRFCQVAFGNAVFSAKKRTGGFAAAAAHSPAGAATQQCGRPDDAVVRIREADRKRGLEDGGQACLQSRFQTLFRTACRNFHGDPKTGFRGELERGLWPSKAALSIVSPTYQHGQKQNRSPPHPPPQHMLNSRHVKHGLLHTAL